VGCTVELVARSGRKPRAELPAVVRAAHAPVDTKDALAQIGEFIAYLSASADLDALLTTALEQLARIFGYAHSARDIVADAIEHGRGAQPGAPALITACR
jgi:hypothetical protein